MAFFRLPIAAEEPPGIRGKGLALRPPRLEDFDAWAALREASRDFLKPWEPVWPSDDLTKPAFRRRLKRYAREIEDDSAYPFFLFREADGALLGGLTLGMVRRGVSQAATLGYWMGQPHAGAGAMTTGVRLACTYAFETLRLRRIEAACVPYNIASTRVLEKVGFQREGYARQYLCIDGLWQDHLLFALLRAEFAADTPSP